MKKDFIVFIKKNALIIASAAICLLLVVGIIFIPFGKKEDEKIEWSEYSSVNEICELATLKSYYHNVALLEEKPEGAIKVISDILTWPFNQILRTGYKQIWQEYSGIVEIGIDLKKDRVLINNPDSSGVVDVYIPDAKVLDVRADMNSFSEPMDDRGLFTTITAKERNDAYVAAQDKMRQQAEGDQSLLRRAKTNAKILIEKYIVNLGKEMGVDYTINWVDKPW